MPNKKILLINPPFYRLMNSHFNDLNLGLAYIAAVLQKQGFLVKIYNADFVDSSNFLTQEELFHNYQGYKDILNNEQAPIWKEIKKQIKDFSPDWVGISIFTGAYKSAQIIAQMAKEINPKVKVVVGGPHATLSSEQTMQNTVFDYLIRGEGEQTFTELLNNTALKDIKGLSYRNNDKIIHNPNRDFIRDLDQLPFPSRDAMLNKGDNLSLGNIITGRGCPFACRFCASPKLWQRKIRFRSPENVLQELEEMVKKYHQKLIYFVDDTFTADKERAMAICQGIIDRKLDIKWKCDTRADRLDKELLDLMKKSGCICAKIGAESGSPRVLRLMGKNEKIEDIRRGANLIKEAGIALTVYFMAGFPGEINEDLKKTIRFAEELSANYYSLSIVSPYYGTDIYFELKEKGELAEKEPWEYFFHQSMETIQTLPLDQELLEKFLSINKLYGTGKRI